MREPSLPPDKREAALKQARKWFAILLAIGLVLGAVVAVGVVKLLGKLGLSEKPERLPRIEPPTESNERSL